MERGQNWAKKLCVSFHGLFLKLGKKGNKNKCKILVITSVRERCIPCFKVWWFGIAPQHALAVHAGLHTHTRELCGVPEVGLDSSNMPWIDF